MKVKCGTTYTLVIIFSIYLQQVCPNLPILRTCQSVASRDTSLSSPGNGAVEHINELDLSSERNWKRQWHPTPVLLPGKSRGRRSLVGCSPWGLEESDTTERLHFHFSLLCIGEGNGNPLQCSCLENPRDGVAQSWTRLKWFSSSSSSEKNGRRKWHPTPVLLPGKSHGWRSLVGCSPWGH